MTRSKLCGNYQNLSLYLVSEGGVTAANASTEWDGINTILVAATSEQSALAVAQQYDYGQAQACNLQWHGETISVVVLRDRNTGDYL